MKDVFRMKYNHPRIAYAGKWTLGDGFTSTSTPDTKFFFLFRGTSVKFYGHASRGGSLTFTLDGTDTDVPLNSTNSANEPSLIFSFDNMKDGDHQLYGKIASLQVNGSLAVDYFEIENSSGGGFSLLSAGRNATNVPKEAVIVDNTRPEINFHNASRWFHEPYVASYAKTRSHANTTGASLSYSFDGVAIWYYGSASRNCGFFTVSIDSSPPQRLSCKGDVQLNQRLLWSNTSLDPGEHTITLTQDDKDSAVLPLDFFRVLRSSDASTTSPATLPTATQPVASTNERSTVPLVVGLALGLLALLTLVLGGGCCLYRRRRTSIGLDALPDPPYVVPTMTQATQQPQDSKRLQPIRPAGGAMAEGEGPSGVSFVMTELEPPPSYISHVHDERGTTGNSAPNEPTATFPQRIVRIWRSTSSPGLGSAGPMGALESRRHSLDKPLLEILG